MIIFVPETIDEDFCLTLADWDKSLKCSICKDESKQHEKITNKSQLMTHLKIHDVDIQLENPYLCPIENCALKFPSKTSLKGHIDNHRKIARYNLDKDEARPFVNKNAPHNRPVKRTPLASLNQQNTESNENAIAPLNKEFTQAVDSFWQEVAEKVNEKSPEPSQETNQEQEETNLIELDPFEKRRTEIQKELKSIQFVKISVNDHLNCFESQENLSINDACIPCCGLNVKISQFRPFYLCKCKMSWIFSSCLMEPLPRGSWIHYERCNRCHLAIYKCK